ncbi:hypothetical protein CPB85DRAFT_1447333 [Mucidula mucida]|nr:hypothetical protein CPB85DRAFT_1447333 [Mucidula mucida]
MFFGTTLALLSGASAVLAFVPPPVMMQRDVTSTSTDLSKERREAAEKHFLAAKAQATPRGDLKTGPIPIFWNVIYENTTYQGGYLDAEQIAAQIDVLNADFGSAGVSWQLADIAYSENKEWFQSVAHGTAMHDDMKTALRQGDAATLNVYSVGFFGSDILGYATFPEDYSRKPWDDGIVLKWTSLPGGVLEKYNLGKTLTHEAGHWVGLYHTFEGGCENEDDGDKVADTPAQFSSTDGCPVSRHSCNEAVFDPIHNYMDYSDDICSTEFTAGQIQRLQAQMRTFRKVDITVQ